MMLSVIALCCMFGVIGCVLDKKIIDLEGRLTHVENVLRYYEEVNKNEIGVD